ncbi:MAG: hypothetical protein V4813_00680, partial [Gemmatimonadota bacterium]
MSESIGARTCDSAGAGACTCAQKAASTVTRLGVSGAGSAPHAVSSVTATSAAMAVDLAGIGRRCSAGDAVSGRQRNLGRACLPTNAPASRHRAAEALHGAVIGRLRCLFIAVNRESALDRPGSS